jgi:hypothetical protein
MMTRSPFCNVARVTPVSPLAAKAEAVEAVIRASTNTTRVRVIVVVEFSWST